MTAKQHPVVPNEKIRLSKVMADRGLCSRREADEFIAKGWVLVDNVCVSTLGTKIDPQQDVSLAPAAQARLAQDVTILLNKPLGYVSGQPEKGYPAAVTLITPQNRYPQDKAPIKFHPRHLAGLAPAGRLDIDSQGLLVLTQNGRMARLLIGAQTSVEKEYVVRVQGQITAAKLAMLQHGLMLDEKPLKPARVSRQGTDRLVFILKEGRKRQIRRMCTLVDLKVIGLKRVRIGGVALGQLPVGQWRYLGPGEHFQRG